MLESLFSTQLLGNFLKKSSILLSLFFLMGQGAFAQNLPKNLQIKTAVEIGDETNDYADADKTVSKGRFIFYQIQVSNVSSIETLNRLTLLMDTPDSLDYVSNSAKITSGTNEAPLDISDINGESALQWGFTFDSLNPSEKRVITLQFQVSKDIPETPAFTLAWASVLDVYSGITVVSNTVENRIFGESAPGLQATSSPLPEPGTPVSGGSLIYYNYQIRNTDGEIAKAVKFTPMIPAHTQCLQGCVPESFGDLGPNEIRPFTLLVEVSPALDGVNEIKNLGFDLTATGLPPIQNRTPIVHPTSTIGGAASGALKVDIRQSPNLVLNTANGEPRPDKADLTETLYTLTYQGRHIPYTYPNFSGNGGYTYPMDHPCSHYYPQMWGATTTAYNSSGGYCDNIANCPISSSPLIFNINTTLPTHAPKLEFTVNIPTYPYGSNVMADYYMENGGTLPIPTKLTESRATENGGGGQVATAITLNVTEDTWRYQQYSTEECTYTEDDCEEDCERTMDIPLFRWEKASSTLLTETAKDTTDISVYTSTAWLKTKGGHIGTNDRLSNGTETLANFVDLGIPAFSNHLTPSSIYTPPDETNAELMIFGKNGTDSMKTKSSDLWKVTGTDFGFLKEGDAYDRANNPRDFKKDLLLQEKYGPVKKDALLSPAGKTLELGDGNVWAESGNYTFGQEGVDDTVTLSGGQARIYVEGDVFINANLKFSVSSGSHYRDLTSVRIDARNIYVSGEVTDIQAFLQARESFHTGRSKNQLRILGDVIAGNTYWERQPLLETKPEEFNKPSEYLIEDLRKYVVPPPGDTEVPEDYQVWKQVNPSTGE